MTIDQAITGTRAQALARHYPCSTRMRFASQGSASKPATSNFASKNGSGTRDRCRDGGWLKRGAAVAFGRVQG